VNYRRVLKILHDHGFALARTKGSHRTFKARINGVTRIVSVAYHRESEDVRPKTLASIIRQSGLGKKVFQ
jgi:predicted RNA binding protein YcfA (HicA-like mRNA interferase family)